ncbi:flagellar hook-length control protein FliK [Salicola sp. Rm-C-2C1-2]|uniref:flagellar hook-length control protein FliK n=1 Tax=Salicola sp. Rm-C-2C1-2 TaxID=3141321 RepID=UPI0032E4B59B
MQMPDIRSDLASVSGRSGNGGDGKGADGSAFGELHRDVMGGSAGTQGLKPGDVLRNGEGNVVGRIVRGDDGGLQLALEGREGQGIPLEQLSSLLQGQDGSGLESLQALFAGELDLNPESEGEADWLQQLENLTNGEQQGVMAALAGLNGFQGNDKNPGAGSGGGNGLPLTALTSLDGGVGGHDGSVRNSTSKFLENLLSGMAMNGQNAQKSDASSTDLRFEGLRLLAVENSSGQESNSRNSDASGLTQQTFTRAEAARDATLRQYTTTVETPVQQQKQWSEQVAGKIAWLAGRSIQSADIQLNPPDMGPIDVRVQVQNDQAQVTVNAQNSQVREMLELNSSRLRDMLEQEGLSLAGFDVSGEAPDGEDDSAAESEGGENGDARAVSGENDSVATGETTISLDDGIDTYA